jgi:hypothetical protein
MIRWSRLTRLALSPKPRLEICDSLEGGRVEPSLDSNTLLLREDVRCYVRRHCDLPLNPLPSLANRLMADIAELFAKLLENVRISSCQATVRD